MKELRDERILARWLSGELSEEQTRRLAQKVDLDKLREAVEAGSDFPLDTYDLDAEWQRLSKEKAAKAAGLPQKPIRLRRAMTIAASALILIAATWLLWPSGFSLHTPPGQHATQLLPDGSGVSLNAGSELTFEIRRDKSREVRLEGEAFFEVTTGQAFSVWTSGGQVQVLGTSFNVYSRDGIFKVDCYSGKVRVRKDTARLILMPGQTFESGPDRNSDAGSFELTEKPDWIRGISSFKNMPLHLVFKEMERQYDVKIKLAKGQDRLYSGRFVHNDLREALREVCSVMQLNYEINNNRVNIY